MNLLSDVNTNWLGDCFGRFLHTPEQYQCEQNIMSLGLNTNSGRILSNSVDIK